MKIMVSACLSGQNCKYNGGNNLNEKVMKLIKGSGVTAELLIRHGFHVVDVEDLEGTVV